MATLGPTFSLDNFEKNNGKSSFSASVLDRNIYLARFSQDGANPGSIRGQVPAKLIQFFFCLKGGLTFHFNQGRYLQTLTSGKAFLFYNPDREMPHQISLEVSTELLLLCITVERLHELFIEDSSELHFLDSENINKKFYAERPIPAGLGLVLSQFFNGNMVPSNQKLYYTGKTFELLSLFFNQEETGDPESCPFLLDEANVERIRQAKRIIIDRMQSPPSLKELAREVGLNEYQLKVGFKNIYGSPVFQFLTDYKMVHARKLLDTQGYKVNEVGFMVGYSNPSHFIAAFKRKFGTTPKKYLMSLQ